MGNSKGLKRDFNQLQQRRFRAAKLFDRGYSKSEVAQRLGVSAQSTSRWYAAWQADGIDGLKKAGRAGRKSRLDSDQIHQLEQALLQGPQVLGYETPLWTAARVVDLIQRQTGIHYHPDHIYRLLQQLGWSCERPVGRALERDERAIRRWKRQRWPDIKKKRSAKTGGLSSLNESGLSQQPHRVRTWAPRGCTPVLQYHFNWKKFSVMAGLTIANFDFQLFDGAIKSAQVIEFLRHLLQHLPGRLLIVWDGAGIHRSRAVRDFIGGLNQRIHLEHLPAYAPELNPAEYIWGHLKQHELANFCAQHGWELSHTATRALRRMRRRPQLIAAFWKQAELW